MSDRDEVPAKHAAFSASAAKPPLTGDASTPVVLVPVAPEDFQRRKRRIVWVCAISAALIAGGTAYYYKLKVDPIRAREAYDAGERLYRLARFEQAILTFENALAYDPKLAGAYLLLGRSKVGLSKNQDAVADFTKVIELRPGDVTPLLDRAAAYYEIGRFQEAIDDCTRAIELDPELATAYNLRGISHRALNDLQQALADLDRAVELDPIMNHYFERAATLQLLGQHQRALDDLNKVVDFAPLNAQAYHARAQSLRAVGDEMAAERDHRFGRYLDGR